MKTFIEIRRELKKLIVKKTMSCIIEKEKNKAINEARQEINLKYGKDCRELQFKSQTSFPSIYDGHENGEHWMD